MTDKKYKIAILTQALGFNYGGIIQNYALQKVLSDLGHHAVTINRGEENPHSKLKIAASRCKSLLLRYIFKRRVPVYIDYQRISKTNLQFIRRNINISPLLYTTSMLAEYFLRKKFDAVVVGSDQVWRPAYSPNIFNFYLDFLQGQDNIIKVSYAASFGTDQWEYSEEETKMCGELLGQFDGVSVREDSGVLLCNEYLSRTNAVHVLDPAFLLTAGDYSQIIGKAKEESGLFTYVLDESPENMKFIEHCSGTLGLNVHRSQAKLSPDHIDLNRMQDYMIPPIEGWLQGFRDAEFVITDSFHGTVFSIINRKPFFVLVNKSRGAARFQSILTQLGLEDRLIDDLETFDFANLKKNINYEVVSTHLNRLIKESLSFINTHL